MDLRDGGWGWSIELRPSSCGPWRENAHWGKICGQKVTVMMLDLVLVSEKMMKIEWCKCLSPHQSKQWHNNWVASHAGPGGSIMRCHCGQVGSPEIGDQLWMSLPQTSPDRSRVLGVMNSRRCLIKMITSVKWDDNTDFQVVSTPVQDHPTARLSIYPTWTVPGPAIIWY